MQRASRRWAGAGSCASGGCRARSPAARVAPARTSSHMRDRAPRSRRGASQPRGAYRGGVPDVSPCSRGLEPVADAAHGVDAHRTVELLSNLGEVHVDRALVAEPVVTPHAVEYLLATQREPRTLRQELQELEFPGGESDDLSA